MFRVRTLADALNQDQDNFLLLRLLAASMVIYGHSAAISGNTALPDLFTWLGWGVYSGTLAVNAFFVISGLMITGSYLRRGHLPSFLWARFLRIYPAYAFCLLGSAFLLGAIFTELPLRDYLRATEVMHYVMKNLELGKNLAFNLPGVFTGNQVHGAVNGSIWTLPAEVRMYLWVAIVGVSGILARKYLFNILIVALCVWGLLRPSTIPLIPLPDFVQLAAYFALGAFCFINRQWVYIGWPVVFAASALAWLLRDSGLYPFAMAVALASFVFAFAYNIPWYGYNRFGDYSYGLYLWGFPVQQAIAHHIPGISSLANALIAWPLALLLAAFSWYAIEKPMLSLKSLPRKVYSRLKSTMHRHRKGVGSTAEDQPLPGFD
ncbi:acyltransferase family protein [Dyella tabacisoli]|uniref:Acyltransferase n=1 Tax=Dyella tabacisoli TaxID=2282381 RepID=A0A369URB4_9GAMM|nr:acyltransferase [Dyella tabacisoli]RDD80859.1 acyltransferase [Dyella tabacisoli]